MRIAKTLLTIAYNGLIDLGANKYDVKAFEAVSASGAYLPRLALMTSSSEACKSGDFAVNHFAFQVGDVNTDLGTEVDVLVICWRPKALDMSGEQIISSYDPMSEGFRTIQAKADVKDSKCMFGPEYLVYIPKNGKFATFFCGSKSARKESAGLQARLQKAATLKPKKCQTDKYTWFVAQAQDCNTPFDIPSMDDIKEQADKFLNPPAPTVERVETPAAGGRER